MSMASMVDPRPDVRRWSRRALLRAAPALLAGLFAGAACAGDRPADPTQLRRSPSGDVLETPPVGALPSFATARGQRVVEAYRYAAGHRDALRFIPCYCGCGSLGHESNYDCYVYAVAGDGRVTYSAHAAT